MAESPIVAAPVSASPSELEELNLTLREVIEQKDAAVRAELSSRTDQLDSAVANFTAPSAPNAFVRYTYARAPELSSTNSTGWQTKLNLNGFDLPLGTYRIGWSYRFNSNSERASFCAQLLVNGAPLFHHEAGMGGKYATFVPQSRGQHQLAAGFDVLEGLSGTVDFDLQYATDDKKHTASIWGVTLELWRIA